MVRFISLLVFAGLLFPLQVQAQPDWTADPTSGTIGLETGFTPDPVTIDLMAGGADAVEVEGCNGFINSAAPDVDFNFETDGDLPLKIYVRSSTDTVILINTPTGDWICNDDFDGTNAGIEIDEPVTGLYNIWVGTFSQVGPADATLYFTELPEVEVMWDATASQEGLRLASGFSPDPVEIRIDVTGADMNPYEGCTGFINAYAPEATFEFETDGELPLHIYATSDEDDLTLMVLGPDEEIRCNDDASGLNPSLSYEEPMVGTYSIWVGTYSSLAQTEDPIEATLYVSELEGLSEDYDVPHGVMDPIEYNPDDYSGGDDLSMFATPTFGSVVLDPGFTPDPASIDVDMGGPNAVSVTGPGCTGYIDNSAPTANLVYGEGGDMLALFVESEIDGTIVVSMPNGDWVCNDDDAGVNPGVYIENPEQGMYNIWIGTFSQNDAGASGTFFISESTR